LDTLKWLRHETDVWFEITNLIIPTLNDGDAEFKGLCDWVLDNLGDDVPLHFTAFHPDFKLQDKPRTPAATLHRARQIALDAGLHYVYEGNIYSEGANTYCPQCTELLVRRSWHDVLENHMRNGSCPACGFAIAGVWKNDKSSKLPSPRNIASISRNYGHLNL